MEAEARLGWHNTRSWETRSGFTDIAKTPPPLPNKWTRPLFPPPTPPQEFNSPTSMHLFSNCIYIISRLFRMDRILFIPMLLKAINFLFLPKYYSTLYLVLCYSPSYVICDYFLACLMSTHTWYLILLRLYVNIFIPRILSKIKSFLIAIEFFISSDCDLDFFYSESDFSILIFVFFFFLKFLDQNWKYKLKFQKFRFSIRNHFQIFLSIF